jgi:hypothetical protein
LDHWTWILLAAILLSLAWLFPRAGDSLFRPVESFFSRLASKPHASLALLFFGTILFRLALLPLIPVPVPGVHDEFSYLLAADTFAHGRLANPPHPLWLSFDTFHINMLPTYSSMFPPAQGMVLALGQLLGHPWIGVLLSCAALCAAIAWMLQAWLPARWALLGGLIAFLKLAVVSYWINSYFGGAVAALGGALVLGALPRLFRSHKIRHVLLLALGLALLANSRPFEGLAFSLPVAAALLWWLVRSPSPSFSIKLRRVLLPLASLLLLTAGFIAYYNWRTTGDALLMPHALNRRAHPFTLFLWQPVRTHSLYSNPQFDDFYNGWVLKTGFQGTWADFWRIQREKVSTYSDVYLWKGSLFPFLFLPLLFSSRRWLFLLLVLASCSVSLLVVGWSLPHYAAPALCAFYALLLQCLRHLRSWRFAGRHAGLLLSRVLFLLLLFTVASDFRLRFADPLAWRWNGDIGFARRASVAADFNRLPGKHLVLVRYSPAHIVGQEWVYNSADIDSSKVVWARELDAQQNRKLLAYFHDRQAWLLQPDDHPGELLPYASPDNSVPPAPHP